MSLRKVQVLVVFSSLLFLNLNCELRTKRDVKYFHHNKSCDDKCPQHIIHDAHIRKPETPKNDALTTNEKRYRLDVPKSTVIDKEADRKRYFFDMKVEIPPEENQKTSKTCYNYNIQLPKISSEEPKDPEIRYIHDALVQISDGTTPLTHKPRNLNAKFDRVLPPCQNPSLSSDAYTCSDYFHWFPSRKMTLSQSENIPVFESPDQLELAKEFSKSLPRRQKRNAKPALELKTKKLEIKLPKLIPSESVLTRLVEPKAKFIKKETKIVTREVDQGAFINGIKLKWNLPELIKAERETETKNLQPYKKDFKWPVENEKIINLPFLQLSEKKIVTRDAKMENIQRLESTPCGYSYESCDPERHNREGCPLCYRCKCEPAKQDRADAKFSPRDIKIPYRLVSHEESPGKPAMKQEFDDEPSSYTGLRDRDMYNKYIKQVIEKYPEHMSRKMPDLQEQQQDLMKFIGELSKSKSAGNVLPNEDVRYKIIDNAMDMYKQYEKAMNALPKSGKPLKRESAFEIVEVESEDKTKKSYAVPGDDFQSLISRL